MKYNRTNGAALEYTPGGPENDPAWMEVVVYMCIALTFFVLLYGGVTLSRWMS